MFVRLFVLCATQLSFVVTTDYCTEGKCGSTHTLCKYPEETPGEKCLSMSGSGIKAEEVESLLHLHNKWRDHVAAGKESRTLGGALPQAANMGALTWDRELARAAQRWALQCTIEHDQCRNMPGMPVGQSLAFNGNTKQLPSNVTQLASMWYENEVASYDTQGSSAFHYSMETSHFTQWIWARSYKLGCGYSGFQDGKMHKHLLVCNYGPGGNIEEHDLYLAGAPCSKCPNGTTCGGDARYANLCSSDSGEVPDLPDEDIVWVSESAAPTGAPSLGLHCVIVAVCVALLVSGCKPD
ncbi:venom allergen 5-like [Amphibalanus amphitrite]|uniref:venom allergen 5-like n=1 Tax=Amphibalanus amphitrite TaxID=1232801 RepID=UPI001C9217BC|nr:venom allergen 5-like [Amphibalanus amphitrite]